MTQYNGLVPLGKLSITPGTPTPLSTNCGRYGGEQGTDWKNPPVPGNAWRGMEIQADPSNDVNIYLLPRGKTVAANPESILASIGPGGSLQFPSSSMLSVGILPENFALDADTSVNPQVAYGYGTLG